MLLVDGAMVGGDCLRVGGWYGVCFAGGEGWIGGLLVSKMGFGVGAGL
jgi:hypothetical protein